MRNTLIARLAVLAILATMTVACGKGQSPTSPSTGPSAPADPLRGSIIVIAPAQHTNPGALGNQHFLNRQPMNEEVVFNVTGGDPTGEWQYVVPPRPGMEFRQLGPAQFAVRLMPRNGTSTLYVEVHRGERTSVLTLEQAN